MYEIYLCSSSLVLKQTQGLSFQNSIDLLPVLQTLQQPITKRGDVKKLTQHTDTHNEWQMYKDWTAAATSKGLLVLMTQEQKRPHI